MDSSGSISRRNFEKVKLFVSDVASKFDISPKGSRAALILYSTRATTKIQFSDHTSTESFASAVKFLNHERGFTRIDLALQRANLDLFGRRGTARSVVPKIAFLLTDGEQTPDPRAIPLAVASAPLKATGVRMIAIGIGRNVKRNQLNTIASSSDDVILATSFDDLLAKVEPVVKSTCGRLEGNWLQDVNYVSF